MNIAHTVSLASHSTMRLGGTADFLVEVHTRDALQQAVRWAQEHQAAVIVIGSGSNIVWRDEGFHGLVIVNKIAGYTDVDNGDGTHTVTAGAGEVWDEVVARTVEAGLTGIEALSLIPGTAGATPVQNVGAYGQEIAHSLVSVEVYDAENEVFTNLPGADCGFGYRTSRFKTDFRDRYYIVGITLRLQTGNPQPPFYGAVQTYLANNAPGQTVTPALLRSAVVTIRTGKLPDPALVANNGSFFANPVVNQAQFEQLLAAHPDMPNWPLEGGGAKIPAAWLIEQTGFRDYHDEATGMATWATQPLVLVNEHARSTADLLAFKQKIVDAVNAKFGVLLTQEPELLP